ncbi:hypothetical protein EJB05_29369, partial [Eragrostis curvula]
MSSFMPLTLVVDFNDLHVLNSVHHLHHLNGYRPPEFYKRQRSKSFDIFGLGVVILQLVTGYKGYSKMDDKPREKFIYEAQQKWRDQLSENYKDSLLEVYCKQVKVCIEIGCNCVEVERQKRPKIAVIINQLIETENGIPSSNVSQENENLYQTRIDGKRAMTSESDPALSAEHQNMRMAPSSSVGSLPSSPIGSLISSSQPSSDRPASNTRNNWGRASTTSELQWTSSTGINAHEAINLSKVAATDAVELKERKEEAVTLKIRLHCDGCIDRIKRRIYKIEDSFPPGTTNWSKDSIDTIVFLASGVKDVAADAAKDLVKVTGTMDVAALSAYLREKLNRPVEAIAPGKDGGGDKKDDGKKDRGAGDGKKHGGGEEKDKSAAASMSVAQAPMADAGMMYQMPPPYSYPFQLTPAPQIFSDENPNACCLM